MLIVRRTDCVPLPKDARSFESKGKFVPVHVTKACREKRGVVPLVLKLLEPEFYI